MGFAIAARAAERSKVLAGKTPNFNIRTLQGWLFFADCGALASLSLCCVHRVRLLLRLATACVPRNPFAFFQNLLVGASPKYAVALSGSCPPIPALPIPMMP